MLSYGLKRWRMSRYQYSPSCQNSGNNLPIVLSLLLTSLAAPSDLLVWRFGSTSSTKFFANAMQADASRKCSVALASWVSAFMGLWTAANHERCYKQQVRFSAQFKIKVEWTAHFEHPDVSNLHISFHIVSMNGYEWNVLSIKIRKLYKPEIVWLAFPRCIALNILNPTDPNWWKGKGSSGGFQAGKNAQSHHLRQISAGSPSNMGGTWW